MGTMTIEERLKKMSKQVIGTTPPLEGESIEDSIRTGLGVAVASLRHSNDEIVDLTPRITMFRDLPSMRQHRILRCARMAKVIADALEDTDPFEGRNAYTDKHWVALRELLAEDEPFVVSIDAETDCAYLIRDPRTVVHIEYEVAFRNPVRLIAVQAFLPDVE